MLRERLPHRRVLLAIAATLLLTLATADRVWATIVGAQSYGHELANARISVFFAQSGVRTATVVVGGPLQGIASDPGFFDFSVTGDTFLADWELTNTTTFDFIDAVLIDLSATTSPGSPAAPGPHTPGVLFDDGKPAPSNTPNGYAGRQGAVQVNPGVPLITASQELVLWGDPMNLGDEYVQEEILYADFGPGMTSVWRDDTDIVGIDTGRELPEPTTAGLLLVATCGLLARSRRRPA